MSAFFDRIDAVPDIIAAGFCLAGIGCLALSDWRGKNGQGT